MRKIIALILLPVLAACHSGKNNGERSNKADSEVNAVPEPQTWRTFDSNEFSVGYPMVWEFNSTRINGTAFTVYAPTETRTDRFRDNLSLIIQKITDPSADLKKYTAIMDKKNASIVGNFKMIAGKDSLAGAESYHWSVFSGQLKGYRVRMLQRLRVANNTAYVLTLTTEYDHFEKLKKAGERIMDSFHIK